MFPERSSPYRGRVTVGEVSLLGRFAVRIDGTPIPDAAWRRSRAAYVVKVLALTEGHRLLREQVMDLLWPDLDAAAAGANLRKALHFARQALGSADSIADRGGQLELLPQGLTVDAVQFEEVAQGAILSGHDYEAALALYPGDLLPEDRYAEWAQDARDRLRGLHLDLLRAAGHWQRVLAIDPADEAAHRGLMQEALDAGDRSGVVRQFGLLRSRLRADLGVGPDRDSVTLYEKALGMSPATPPSPHELAQSLLARALVELNSGQFADAAQAATRARTLAVEAHLGREAGEACAILGILANLRGEWPDAYRADFEESVRRPPELASFVFDAHTCLAEYSLIGPLGHEQFNGLAGQLAATAREHHSVHGSAIGELLSGEIALLSGRLDDAANRLEAALKLHREAGASSGEVLTLQRLAELALASGDRRLADTLLDAALPMAGESWLEPHLVVRTHGLLVDAAEDPVDAAARTETADRHLDGSNICPPCSLGFHIAAAKALAGSGALQASRRRLEQAERISGLWPGGAAHAAVWEARAVVRRAHGDGERARAFWQEAADRYAEVGRPVDRDRCLAHVSG